MKPIDGDALIAAIEQMIKHQIDADDICEMIQNFSPIEPEREKGKWIPCSERLPEKDGEYFTTLIDEEGAYVDVTEWQSIIGGRWVNPFDECDYCEIGNVIAWMPLPEPYHGEDQNG